MNDPIGFLVALSAAIVLVTAGFLILLTASAYDDGQYTRSWAGDVTSLFSSRSAQEYDALTENQRYQIRRFLNELQFDASESLTSGALATSVARALETDEEDVPRRAEEIRDRAAELQERASHRTQEEFARAESSTLWQSYRIALRTRRKQLTWLRWRALSELLPGVIRRLVANELTTTAGYMAVAVVVLFLVSGLSLVWRDSLDITTTPMTALFVLGTVATVVGALCSLAWRVFSQSPGYAASERSPRFRRDRWWFLSVVLLSIFSVAVVWATDWYQRFAKWQLDVLPQPDPESTLPQWFFFLLAALSLLGALALMRSAWRGVGRAVQWSRRLEIVGSSVMGSGLALGLAGTAVGVALDLSPGELRILAVAFFGVVASPLILAASVVAGHFERRTRLRSFSAVGLEVRWIPSPWLVGIVASGGLATLSESLDSTAPLAVWFALVPVSCFWLTRQRRLQEQELASQAARMADEP